MFESTNAAIAAARRSHLPTSRRSSKAPFRDAVALQDALFRDAIDPDTNPAAKAQLARAWEVLEQLKRLIRMKPAPKPIDVSVKPAKRPRNVVAFTEPGSGSLAQQPSVPRSARSTKPHTQAPSGTDQTETGQAT